MKQNLCAYCGQHSDALDMEHVFPRCLYPKSKHGSKVQRLTVPACKPCNKSFQDDEVHFRNVLLVSGQPNASVYETWETAVRSFKKCDGPTRAADVGEQVVAMQTEHGPRHMIYPGKDQRVMRIIRKIVRGLCFHHQMRAPVPDEHIWADVQRFRVPPAFLAKMTVEHREADIVQYRYAHLDDGEIGSLWLVTFFERTPFIAIVLKSPVLGSASS
jgi:hypothetical protein